MVKKNKLKLKIGRPWRKLGPWRRNSCWWELHDFPPYQLICVHQSWSLEFIHNCRKVWPWRYHMIRIEGSWSGRKVGLGVISEKKMKKEELGDLQRRRLGLSPDWVLSCLCSGTPQGLTGESAYVTGQGCHLWTTARNHFAVYSQRKLRLGHSQTGTSATHSSCFIPFK